MSRPYDHLSKVYDRWTDANNYDLWAQFIEDAAGGLDSTRVLDVCCGTGRLLELLTRKGARGAGIDGSASMLEHARERGDGSLTLAHSAFPFANVSEQSLGGRFDLILCTFDSLNYVESDQILRETFVKLYDLLRVGGVFLFDLNTERKLVSIFGNTSYGDDCDEYAYVWRNRLDDNDRAVTFDISLFIHTAAERYERHRETHRQRWYPHEEVVSAAENAGFSVEGIYDDYSSTKASESTLRETWVLRR